MQVCPNACCWLSKFEIFDQFVLWPMNFLVREINWRKFVIEFKKERDVNALPTYDDPRDGFRSIFGLLV